ncbi:MAG: VOC family protein [Blastocatellia bacterium]|nr:VOC family protein [Blastocatellia bacterium]
MSSEVKPIPEGFHTITPGLIVNDAAGAIEFYKEALGAEEIARMTTPDGNAIMHSELKIGNSIFFVSDEFPDMGSRSPKTLGGTPISLNLYLEDVDASFERAVAAGAQAIMPVADMFWGDRFGMIADPFGHTWGLCTHIKDLTSEEVVEASKEYFSKECADTAETASGS